MMRIRVVLLQTPQNINGNWNAFGLFGFNSALKDKKVYY